MTKPPSSDLTFVISDLHLAEGNLGKGITLGTENFFSGYEFARFIHFLIEDNDPEKLTSNLIINGDFVDFIRITRIPESPEEFMQWQSELDKVNAGIRVDENHVGPREKNYGLKTNDYKSVWKLFLSIRGHAELFQALAQWIDQGNHLTIIVGNHDPEWHWLLVQDYLDYKLAEMSKMPGKINEKLKAIKKQTFFYDEACQPYPKVWIEHGHNYEKTTRLSSPIEIIPSPFKPGEQTKVSPHPDRQKELMLPFGSFFNRYLINKVEIIFPYVDNLKTGKALFTAIFNEDFAGAFKILKNYGFYTIRIVLKYFRKSIWNSFLTLLVTALPVGLLIWAVYTSLNSEGPLLPDLPGWASTLLEWLRNLSPILLRYLLKLLYKWLGLTDKPLPEAVMDDFKKGKKLSDFDAVFVGHNHHPELKQKGGKTYVNTGTWTSKYVFKYKFIQSGTKFAVGRITRLSRGNVEIDLLEWNASHSALGPLTTYSTEV